MMKEDSTMKFEVGDVVEWCGVRGIVQRIESRVHYPLVILFEENKREVHFTLEGYFHGWHTRPSLVLIERPEKKIKRSRAFHVMTVLHPDKTVTVESLPEEAIIYNSRGLNGKPCWRSFKGEAEILSSTTLIAEWEE